MRFELWKSGREHVSREWATVHGIIVVHSRETQEGPETGNGHGGSAVVNGPIVWNQGWSDG